METLNSTISTAIFAVVAIPLVVIALVILVIMLRSSRKARASMSWKTTSGRILASEITAHQRRESNGTHTTIYEPAVHYEYRVNGQRLQSSRVSFGMSYGTSWTQPAQNVIDKYPLGTLVQVYYNPDNPAEAVLERSSSGSNRSLTCVVVLLLGILLIAGAGFLLMQGFMGQIMKLVPHF